MSDYMFRPIKLSSSGYSDNINLKMANANIVEHSDLTSQACC
jgi:hypothetical protein